MSEQSPSIDKGGIVHLPLASGRVVEVDMRLPYVTLARIEEVAYVTKHKAPELQKALNKAFLEFSKWATKLKLEQDRAESNMERVRSMIILDRAEAVLKSKGFSKSSQDLREAVVQGDPEYIASKDLHDRIAAFVQLFKHNMKALERAFQTVYQQAGERRMNMMVNSKEDSLDGLIPEGAEVGRTT